MHNGFLIDVALSIILSSLLAIFIKALKQPLIVGYVATGIILGPGIGFGLINNPQNIELISEIGLIFLLFIIGTEIKVKDMIEKGKDIIILSLSQMIFGSLLIFFMLFLMNNLNLTLSERIYLSFTLNLTSTLIVVKILKDKFEIQTLAAKITIGILIFQDLIATIFLVFQKDFSNPHFFEMLKSISLTIVLFIFSFFSSRYLFLKIIHKNSNSLELVIIVSIGYCFAISSLASLIGISKEMGALIAGFLIGNSPYTEEIVIKLSSIRDFFVTLFFVSLGLKTPLIDLDILKFSSYLVVVVFISRVASIIFLYRILKVGIRPLFITSINLFPVSEFSLVISSLALSYNHISNDVSTTILITMILTSLTSTYLIGYSHQIYSFISRRTGIEKLDQNFTEIENEKATLSDVLILGFNNLTAELIKGIKNKEPLSRIFVADFNVGNMRKIEELGAKWIYVDLSSYQSLKRLENLNPPFIISPLTNLTLKGTDLFHLYLNVKSIFPKSKIIFIAETDEEHSKLLEAGSKVINKSKIISHRIIREIFPPSKKNKQEKSNLENLQ